MSSSLQSKRLYLPQMTVKRLANLCGSLHQNFSLIEKNLEVTIKTQQNTLLLSGQSASLLAQAKKVIFALYRRADHPITIEAVRLLLNIKELDTTMLQPIKPGRRAVVPQNARQAEYLKSIDSNTITFATGPAGTGKTWLAVARAIECFEKGEVQKLVFVRPAVEAGEKLGFLPGDLVEKVLPYLRPIYDALYEMLGFKETQKLIQSDVIEILPLAFMRGRTLNDAFIILDEAQNTSILQMKMFLTRMGFGSRAVITGDMTQVDLPKGTDSGLAHAIKLFAGLEEIGMHHFTSREVVRHPLVSRIIDCYDKAKGDNK